MRPQAGLISSVAFIRPLLGPEPRRERTRFPSLEVLVWKELRAFMDYAAPYTEMRRSWPASQDGDATAALDALGQTVSARIGVSQAVVTPLIAQMLIRF